MIEADLSTLPQQQYLYGPGPRPQINMDGNQNTETSEGFFQRFERTERQRTLSVCNRCQQVLPCFTLL